jgi:integrase
MVVDPDDPRCWVTLQSLPAFVFSTRYRQVQTRMVRKVSLAFEFLILTASHTSEVIRSTWQDFDQHGAVWNFPGNACRVPHCIPLAPRCLEILQEMERIGGNTKYVFTGMDEAKPLSNAPFIERMRVKGVSTRPFDFRAMFFEWAAAAPDVDERVALAHLQPYLWREWSQGKFAKPMPLDEHRKMLEAWGRYLVGARH